MGTSLSPSSGRQPSSGSGAPRFKSAVPEINITPLVDVVLVLLIIFMVIAPALEHGERVELPAVKNDDKTDKGKMDPVTVTMGASGALFLEKEAVALTALPARLRSIHEREPNRKFVLKGDMNLPYEKIRQVFALIQDEGITQCALVVSKQKNDPSDPTTKEN